MPEPIPVEVRPLTTPEEFDTLVDLQHRIWGYADRDVESRSILTVASRFSGEVLGAFHEGAIIGFSLAFVTLEHTSLHSHRVGVLPDFQRSGIGRILKLAQRENALRRGFRSIHWTFDPLQAANANFNLRKLGGVVRSYLPNLYGITSSPLHAGLPTDRLLVEWGIATPHVLQTLANNHPTPSPDALRISLAPITTRQTLAAQQHLREQLQAALAQGYQITDFDRAADTYILEPRAPEALVPNIPLGTPKSRKTSTAPAPLPSPER